MFSQGLGYWLEDHVSKPGFSRVFPFFPRLVDIGAHSVCYLKDIRSYVLTSEATEL